MSAGAAVGPSLRGQRIRLAATATLGAVALVAVALLGGAEVGDASVRSAQVRGSSWLGTDAIGPVITEVVSSNASTLADEDGDQPDWIELHNPTHEPLDLEGYHLSDDEDDPARWPLPAVVLEPDAHLVVFASGKDRREPTGELHTDFRLAQGDEPVLLVGPDGVTIADRMDAIDIPRNASFGRPSTQLARTCYFAFPSPGDHNDDTCFDDADLGAPTLSHGTGFYDGPFELEITAPDPDATIYYTLDGSYPDPDTNPDNTRVYDGPLAIVDRTPQANTISMIPTTVPEHREFIAPDHEVAKGTPIRARTRSSATSVATYFVGDVPPHGDLAVVTLTVDPDYLFDHDTGIHVGGRLAEEWRQSEAYSESPRQFEYEANFMWRGREWERPPRDELHNAVTFDYCATTASCGFQHHVGLRIHGGSSRTFSNKSFRLYARSDYDRDHFGYDFFDSGLSDHRRVILRNSGSDWDDLRFADAFWQRLMAHSASHTQDWRPVIVYINGEYWGLHNLRERQDEHFLAARHGSEPTAFRLLDNSTDPVNMVRREDPPPSGFLRASPDDPEPYLEWVALVAMIAELDPGSDVFAATIEQEIDTASFFDFLIAHVFPGVRDWVQNNTRWWRADGDGTDGADLRWRWMIADLDSWGNSWGGRGRSIELDYNSFEARLAADIPREDSDGFPFLFNHMMEDPELREAFTVRFADHLNTSFAPARTLAELRSVEELLEADMADHLARWSTGTRHEWRREIDRLADFLTERPPLQRAQLRERFDLGEQRQVSVHFPARHADVALNTVRLAEWIDRDQAASEVTWSGIYFEGQTLQLTAVPTDGARFSHWLIDGHTRRTSERIELPVDGDLQVRLVLDDATSAASPGG